MGENNKYLLQPFNKKEDKNEVKMQLKTAIDDLKGSISALTNCMNVLSVNITNIADYLQQNKEENSSAQDTDTSGGAWYHQDSEESDSTPNAAEEIKALLEPLRDICPKIESQTETISAISEKVNNGLDELKEPLKQLTEAQKETQNTLSQHLDAGVKCVVDSMNPLNAIAEEQQKMNSAVTNVTSILESGFKEINSTLHAMLEVQQSANSEEMNSLKVENADKDTLLRDRDKELSDINNQLQNATHRAERLDDELKEAGEKFEAEKKRLENEYADKLEQEKTAQEASKNRMIAEYEAKLRDIQTEAQQERDELKQSLEALRTQTENDKKALEQEHQKQLKERDEQASAAEAKMKQSLDALKEENDTARGVVGDFAEQTKIYLRLMRAVYECPSMQQYLIDNGMPERLDESARSIITFIAATGSEYRFARDLVNYMVKYKKTDREPITEQEMKLIDQTNAFYFERYQDKYGLSEGDKVLVIPEGMEALSSVNVIFRKADMRDIDKVLGTFRNATALYAPAFREYNSTGYSIKATVAGK